MAFDQPTRNRLERFVRTARRRLTDEFTRQLQNVYGLDPTSGTIAPFESLSHLDDAQRETARILRETVAHYLATTPSADHKEALERVAREQAFTLLNRVAALRLAEARGILIESLSNGYNSKGFQLYTRLGGTALGETGDAYRAYLFSVFDEFALDLRVLFDRFSPHGRLFPREATLFELLDLINDPAIASLWTEDETIGWIYQYFNSKEERKRMRDASAAPRNSRELAVRNQFFTPRYVVEFLTDNTLGRIWYEMTKGKTRLRDQCRYLVRRPREVFLGNPVFLQDGSAKWVKEAMAGDFNALPERPDLDEVGQFALLVDGYAVAEDFGYGDALEFGSRHMEGFVERGEAFPRDPLELWLILFAYQRGTLRHGVVGREEDDPHLKGIRAAYESLRDALLHPPENLSGEDLLERWVFIPHRALKDPRELRLLDPACGSMHFGLCAFDLLEVIYDEAWGLEEAIRLEASPGERTRDLQPLHEAYVGKQELLQDVPRLIIQQNLHGIDIDPRAVQIAGLSLWLRAQRAWQERGVNSAARPQIRRSNIVCAEPMPGEQELLEEFTAQQLSAMPELRLVGQLLHRAFDEMKLAGEAGSLLKIEQELADAVRQARKKWLERPKTEQNVLFAEMVVPEQQQLAFDVSGINDDTFWDKAEDRIYTALLDYAEHAESQGGYQRKLFAEDTARGFALIDVCRKRYDIVLMNPPFGEPTPSSKLYLDREYPHGHRDLYACFVENAFANRLAPQGKVGVISSRQGFFLPSQEDWRRLIGGFIVVCADLGHGVLDDALVETAAYVLDASRSEFPDSHLFIDLLGSVNKDADLLEHTRFKATSGLYAVSDDFFNELPGSQIAYWAPRSVLSIFKKFDKLEPHYAVVRNGMVTCDDFRFVRLIWEIPPASIGQTSTWCWFAKGGEYEPYFSPLHLAVKWNLDGRELEAFGESVGNAARARQSSSFYFRQGLTYPARTTSGFSPRLLPSGVIFSHMGMSVFCNENVDPFFILGILLSPIAKSILELYVGIGDAVESGSAARRYSTGVIATLPVPYMLANDEKQIATRVRTICDLLAEKSVSDERSPYFNARIIAPRCEDLLNSFLEAYQANEDLDLEVIRLTRQIAKIAASAYELDETAQAFVDSLAGIHPLDCKGGTIDHNELARLMRMPIDALVDRLSENGGFNRNRTKKAYIASRRLELLCDAFAVTPCEITEARRSRHLYPPDELIGAVAHLISAYLGLVYGRWDIRFAIDDQVGVSLDPFVALPICPPGMLQDSQNLPARPNDLPDTYPLRISWEGILADDKGHPEDIESRLQEALQIIWKERSESIEQEACEILGTKTLRDYFHKPMGFFADHVQRYSKSRRQAPIYWPLSTRSGAYTLWLYYPRLNDETLYTCVNNFITPKLDREITSTVNQLRAKGPQRSRDEEKEFERLQDLELELQEFRDALLRMTKLPWRPNLDDGVQITAAPLWRLFRLPKWQKVLKETWESLERGDFDWAHLAMTIWPQRVAPKCAKDRSLAIAHEVEDLFWVEDVGRWRSMQSPKQEIEEQKRRQRSEARGRARSLLSQLALGRDGALSSAEVGHRLSDGEWDDRELALLLFPERVAEKCWNDPVLAQSLNLILPQKRTRPARERFIKNAVASGCRDLASHLETALRSNLALFRAFWVQLERGELDQLEIALSLWPDRVIDKCLKERRLAEGHGVEKFFWCQYPSDTWRRREAPEIEIANEIARRRGSSARPSP
jgi:hypothetical protein